MKQLNMVVESEAAKKLQVLEDKIASLIVSFDSKRKNNKLKSFWTHMISLVLGVIITVIIGMDFSEHSVYTKLISLTVTGIITIIGGYNTFFNHQKLWISYNDCCNNLRQLQDDLLYYRSGNDNITMSEIESYKQKLQVILDKVNNSWLSHKQT